VIRGRLTATEARIAGLLAGGWSDDEIAGELGLQPAALEPHLVAVYRKLGVGSRTELALLLGAGRGVAESQTVGKSRLSKRLARCHRWRMPHYLVESYTANSSDAVDEALERAGSVDNEQAGIRYVRTTFVPGDEMVLHMFEAPSAEALDEAGRAVALPCDRIVEAVEGPPASQEGGNT
jgi:DNA-binding CsgD family transcriptional regulator